MIDFERKEHYGLSDLLRIVALLRSEGGCPWDRVQTHASLRRSLLEEAYEAAEAIDREDPALLKEELGDLLLQVVFHADIERQAGDTVLEGWEAIKRREKGQQTTAQALDAVARSLPGLWRAEKLQSKAARDGFDWPDISGALDKLDEEVSELHRAAAGDGDVTEELGDVLFAAVKVGRFAGVDPEVAIHGTCEKFIRRYRAVEEGAAAMGRSVDQLPLETLEALWVQAKGS